MNSLRLRGRRALRAVPALALALAAPALAGAQGRPVRVGEAEPVRIETGHPYARAAESSGPAWRHVFTRPGASYVAVHFGRFELAEGDRVRISHPKGLREVTYRGRGKDQMGRFWATHMPGDTAVVELFADAKQGAFGLAIDQVAYGYPDAGWPEGESPQPEALCGADDSKRARCYNGTTPYNKGRAVARLLINGVDACTGWLIGSEGHLMTNNHCIENAADAANTDYEFMAERACNIFFPCRQFMSCPGDVVASSATFVDFSPACNLDYTLVKLPVNPTPTYGFLRLRPSGPVVGERMYIVGHPGGGGKRISQESSDPGDTGGVCRITSVDEAQCVLGSCSGPPEVGYQCDTEGGSSGSPVIGFSDHQVVALHHCGTCPNRGEAIQAIIADLGSNLPPSALPPGDPFSVSCSPSALALQAGESTTATCTVTSAPPFSSASLSCEDLPSDVSCAFQPPGVFPGVQSQLTVSAAPTAPAGTFDFVVAANFGSLIRRQTSLQLSIATTTPNFLAACDRDDFALFPGTQDSTTCRLTSQNGFTGTVSLGCSDPPANGVTCSVQPLSVVLPANGTVSVTVRFQAGSAAEPVFTEAQLAASSGGITRTVDFTVEVLEIP